MAYVAHRPACQLSTTSMRASASAAAAAAAAAGGARTMATTPSTAPSSDCAAAFAPRPASSAALGTVAAASSSAAAAAAATTDACVTAESSSERDGRRVVRGRGPGRARTRPPPRRVEGEKELHVAPMLDYSKREFRAFLSMLSSRLVPWTEMVVDDTIAHSNKLDDHILPDFDDESKEEEEEDSGSHGGGLPVNRSVCQIGGNDPELCADAVRVCAGRRYRYREVNLNVDCPSDRVSGQREFGAVLMKKADRCVEVVQAMVEAATSLSNGDGEGGGGGGDSAARISVKCRIGVDQDDTLEYASSFLRRLHDEAGCRRFVLHARKCVLGGLMSARQNRSVPPLNYPRVYDLCRLFPDCQFWLNGGVGGLREAREICYGRRTAGGLEEKREEGGDVAFDVTSDDNVNVDGEEAKKETDSSGSMDDAPNHHVPCRLCSLPNGSCIAPPNSPSAVPPNLMGVMLGRAALDNPSLFWDVDRYFYGAESNPCRSRREVLEKYAVYLEGLYPRRCCDDCDEMTWKIPAPEVMRIRKWCVVCREIYGSGDSGSGDGNGVGDSNDEKGPTAVVTTDSTAGDTPPLAKAQTEETTRKIKIAPRIVGRSLKPVRGIFFGLPGAKAFVRELDRLGMDKSVRNCGPGYILRRATRAVPVDVLERDFVRTEDLDDVGSLKAAALGRHSRGGRRGRGGGTCCGL
mmetsp:Transcript_22759/g.67280  ORF Transcript_22759/g.67280 Transcript_22759/m.67280 type:complete len:690 (-) Transcript_22759:1700-3769(-)